MLSNISIPIPSIQVAFLACESYERVLETMARARAELGEIVSAIEFQDRRALELVLRHAPQLRDPMGSSAHAFYVLIETSGYVCTSIELGCLACPMSCFDSVVSLFF